MKHYAIEAIGTGTNTRYCVKQVYKGGTHPAIYKTFKTVKSALEAAFIAGIEVEAVGDLYEIIGIAN